MNIGGIVIIACPFCWSWQLDYTEERLLEAVGGHRWVRGDSFADTLLTSVRATMRAETELLEDLVFEHLRDCFGVPT